MSTIVLCDFCGEALGDDQVNVIVRYDGWIEAQLADPNHDVERLDRSLDLHVACYRDNYRSMIDREGR